MIHLQFQQKYYLRTFQVESNVFDKTCHKMHQFLTILTF
jgi:hypothetical protein